MQFSFVIAALMFGCFDVLILTPNFFGASMIRLKCRTVHRMIGICIALLAWFWQNHRVKTETMMSLTLHTRGRVLGKWYRTDTMNTGITNSTSIFDTERKMNICQCSKCLFKGFI